MATCISCFRVGYHNFDVQILSVFVPSFRPSLSCPCNQAESTPNFSVKSAGEYPHRQQIVSALNACVPTGCPSLELGHFPFVQSVWSDQSVLKWNARVLITGSGQNGPAHGSEWLRSLLQSAKVRDSGELWREKCTRMPWTFPVKLARTSSFQPARTGKWRATLVFSPVE